MKTTDPNQLDPIRQLLQHLFQIGKSSERIPSDLLTEIAGSHELLEKLDLLSTLVTGEKSMLKTQTDSLLTCQECLELLPLYVEAQVKGVDVNLRYLQVHTHLATCADCQGQAQLLYELELHDADSVAQTAPSYKSFSEWHAIRSADAQGKQKGSMTLIRLWQEVQAQVHRLIGDIEIHIADAHAAFGAMRGGLAPQLVPATGFRSRAAADETTELLELPSPETNHLLKVRLGPVQSDAATLILEVRTLMPAASVADAKVVLRDEDGNLLESVTSDKDGLALFQTLDIGKYRIEVIVPEQTWQFTVNLRTMA